MANLFIATALALFSISSISSVLAADNPHGLLRERWDAIPGNAIVGLTSSRAFREAADVVSIVPEAEAPANQGDLYGQRLSGWVTAPVTGNYIFWIAADDSAELWLSTDETQSLKRLIANVNSWTAARAFDATPGQRSIAIGLVAGRKYYIEARHKEGAGGDHLSVAWTVPGRARAIIANTYLTPLPPPPIIAGMRFFATSTTVTMAATDTTAVIRYTTDGKTPTSASAIASGPITRTASTVIKAFAIWPDGRTSAVVERSFGKLGTGIGLAGSYYRGQDFQSGPVVTRDDAVIDFKWTTEPVAGLTATGWSARWMGWLEPRFTEDYTLIARSDDGVKVWVDGILLVDGWRSRAVTEDTAVIRAVAGQRRLVRIEYFQATGSAEMRLRWRSAHEDDAAVPTAQLYPLRGLDVTIPASSAVSPMCLEGVNASGAVVTVTSAGSAVAVKPLSDVEFFADVPLPPAGTTAVTAQAAGTWISRSVVWSTTPVDGTSLVTIRRGDSLKLLFPTAGTWRVEHYYDVTPDVPMTAGTTVIRRFDDAGAFLVVAEDAAGIETGRLTVMVESASLTGPVACEVGFTRGLDVPIVGTDVAFAVTDPTAVQVTVVGMTTAAARLSLACRHRGRASLLARLPGTRGAILAAKPLDLFALEFKGRSGIVVNAANHIGSDALIMRPLVTGLDMTFTMFAHRATFVGGATTLALSTGSLMTGVDPATGETIGTGRFDIEMASGESMYCYNFKIFQAGRNVEELNCQTINGTTCSLDVTRIYFAKGTAATKTLPISCAEKGRNHHDHPVTIPGANAPTIAPPGYKAVCPDPVGVKSPPVGINPPPSAVTVASTPAGNYTVDIDGTSFADKVTVVGVTYSKPEVRPGIPNARNASVTATVTPSDVTVTFAIDVAARASVAPTSGTGSVPLIIDGLVLSGADKDTKLQALLPGVGAILPALPVTVVEPKDYSETPQVTDRTPALKAGSTTIVEWRNDVTVAIKDQFGVVLDASWNGVIVEENVRNAGWSALGALAGGTVNDPVRAELNFAGAPPPGGAVYAAEIVAGTRIATSRTVTSNDPQSLRVVDGGTVSPVGPVNNRVNTLIGPQNTYDTKNSH